MKSKFLKNLALNNDTIEPDYFTSYVGERISIPAMKIPTRASAAMIKSRSGNIEPIDSY